MELKNLLFVMVTVSALNLKFGTISCNAQTSVPSGNVSGTWTLAGSPYNIQGSIQIADATTLTIQPGVTINFLGHYKLNVQGRLLAIGTSTDTIIFTATNTTTGWWGIRFDNTPTTNDTSKIVYCKLQYGNAPYNGNGDYGQEGGALLFANFSKAIISNCNISNCTAQYGGAVACEDYGCPIISNNFISFNSGNGGGIYCYSSSPTIFSNRIASNSGSGIYCQSYSNPIINNNSISNNFNDYGGGIHCYNNSNPSITNNTMANNNANKGGALYCEINSNPTFLNTVLYGNTATISGGQVFLNDEGSDPNFYYCDVQGGSIAFELNGNFYTGIYQNNIDSDPLFVSPTAGSGTGFNGVIADWSLQGNSPCIDTGDPATNSSSIDIMGNPRINNCRIDMGAYENQSGTSFTVTISQISTILCFGNTTGALQATANGVGSPFTYLWSSGGATTSSISNLGAGTYSVTASNSNGCITTATITITPSWTLSLITSKTDVTCQGQCNGSAIVTESGGTGPFTYLWNTSPPQNSSATAATLCAGTYSVSVTDSVGCLYTASIVIGDSFSILVTPYITNASCNNSDGSILINDSTISSNSYLWSNGSTNQNLSGIGSGTYSVTVTDTNGCAVSDTLIVSTIAPNSIPICMVTVDSSSTRNVIVWEKPISTAIDSFRIYREIASVYNHIGSVAYSSLSEFTDNTNGINPNTTSYKYKLSVMDSCGTESLFNAAHQTVHLQISAAIPQGVNLSWNDYLGFTFSQYRILRDDLGNGSWHAIDSVSFGITTYTSTDLLPNAHYIVEAKRPTPCVSTRQINSRNSSKSNTTSQLTGVNNLSNDLSVMIYPNPTNGKFKIELSNSQLKNNKCEIKIYNLLGEKVFQSSSINGQTSNEIDLSASPKGIYFVQIYNENKNHSEKIIVQ